MEVQIKLVKLTKKLISQMESPSTEQLKDCTVLGYIVNAKKNFPKMILLESDGDYFVERMGWTQSYPSHVLQAKKSRGCWIKQFKDSHERDAWFEVYQAASKKATEHIYF